MKNFEAFLKESYVGKDGNIYASKNEAEKTIAKINQLKTDKLKDEVSKRKLNQIKQQELLSKQYNIDGGYGDSNTGAGANTQNNPKNTVFKPKSNEIKTSKEIIKQHTPGTNVTVNPSKTNITKNTGTVTTNVTNTKNPITVNDYKGLSSSSTGNIVKTTKPQVTTNVTNTKKFKSFLDRVLVSTGVKTDPKYKSKFTTPTSNVTVSGAQSGTNKVLKDVGKKALRSKIFKGLGRFAGGAFAVKDAVDKARDERRLGRSRTSQILGGIAKGAGGYLGGALGATLGTLAGGGIGSFALGTGGAIAGYNLGSKAGDYLYKKGRQLATGEIKLPGKKSFKKFKDDVSNKVKNLNLSNLGRNKSDKK
ncbi:MAG: hypothetical protein VXW67_04090 [Bacteroidota bacterium]|nr:hypothetical protein [Bacteroidota bacterium]